MPRQLPLPLDRFPGPRLLMRGWAWFALLALIGKSTAIAQEPATLKARAPELEERSEAEWINSNPLKLSELRGQVVVLHFWTFGCINCQHNFPSLKAWQKTFSKKGITIIGVHTPETPDERKIENVRKSVAENGLTYPIVFDKDARTWKTWDNRWWPSTYLIDKNGFVRYRWDGELNWKRTKGAAIMRKKIEQLLAEPGPKQGGNAQD
jgi:peroxiredoxin